MGLRDELVALDVDMCAMELLKREDPEPRELMAGMFPRPQPQAMEFDENGELRLN